MIIYVYINILEFALSNTIFYIFQELAELRLEIQDVREVLKDRTDRVSLKSTNCTYNKYRVSLLYKGRQICNKLCKRT